MLESQLWGCWKIIPAVYLFNDYDDILILNKHWKKLGLFPVLLIPLYQFLLHVFHRYSLSMLQSIGAGLHLYYWATLLLEALGNKRSSRL